MELRITGTRTEENISGKSKVYKISAEKEIKEPKPAEKQNTKLLNASRRQRIAKGSGTTVQDINKFINSYEMTQKMMKKMQNNKGGMRNMLKGLDQNSLKNMKF